MINNEIMINKYAYYNLGPEGGGTQNAPRAA